MKNRLLITCLSILLSASLISCGNGGNNKSDKSEPETSETSEPIVNMSESYAKAREDFYKVTGIMLPALEGLEVGEFPYEEGAKSYCFDIIGGDNLSHQTYETFLAFFDSELSSWNKSGAETSGEYTNVDYEIDKKWIGLTWDETNQAVYINAVMDMK